MATTFTITDEKIEKKYSSYELQMQFLDFLRQKWDILELYEIELSSASKEVQDAYNDIDNMNFIKR